MKEAALEGVAVEIRSENVFLIEIYFKSNESGHSLWIYCSDNFVLPFSSLLISNDFRNFSPSVSVIVSLPETVELGTKPPRVIENRSPKILFNDQNK